MLRLRGTVVITLTLVCVVTSADYSFPKDFLVGVGTSAFQTEGAWNVDGKSESNWDHLSHTKFSVLLENATADDACKSYYNYKEDVQLIKNLGVDAYRYSVSWPRVLPSGVLGKINRKGLQFYKNLTQELIDNNIKPIVTIYHWDHPNVLEEMGGWLNEKMIDWFVDYARIVIEELGPMVKTFTTINEITDYCRTMHDHASRKKKNPSALISEYNKPDQLICIHNMLKAHAKVYHMYDKEYRPIQRGQIGVLTACHDLILRNASDPSHIAFAEIAWELDCDLSTHPIWIGDYPESVKTRIAKTSEARGYSASALPEFSPAWVEYIRGTSDYFGLNYYNSFIISPPYGANSDSSLMASLVTDIRIHAIGLRRTLLHIKNKYNNPPIIILENGHHGKPGLDDPDRMNAFNLMLKETLKSIRIDKTNVTGYFLWSLLDSFEWLRGYRSTCGIFDVDFTSPDRKRTPKLSAKWWKKVLETRDLDAVDTNSFMTRNGAIVDESSTRSSSSSRSSETSSSSLMFTVAITCAVLFWKRAS